MAGGRLECRVTMTTKEVQQINCLAISNSQWKYLELREGARPKLVGPMRGSVLVGFYDLSTLMAYRTSTAWSVTPLEMLTRAAYSLGKSMTSSILLHRSKVALPLHCRPVPQTPQSDELTIVFLLTS